jgi:hypothetical protein
MTAERCAGRVYLFARVLSEPGNFHSFFGVGNCPDRSCAICVKGAQYPPSAGGEEAAMIRKLKSGGYRLYSRKINPRTGRRRNLGTFKTRAAAEKHERAVQYFKRH